MCCPGQAVKDLAVTLRGTLSMKTADAFRAVYCWQTVRCMELWARVLAEHVHTVRTLAARVFALGVLTVHHCSLQVARGRVARAGGTGIRM